MTSEPSEINEILHDKRLRGVRLLRKAGFTYLKVLAVGPMAINPPKTFALVATHNEKQRHVYLARDEDVLHPRWKSLKDLQNHLRSKINKAALRLYKQYREEQRKYWESPEGRARAKAAFQALCDESLRLSGPIIKNYIDRSAETYRRFAAPPIKHGIGKSKYF